MICEFQEINRFQSRNAYVQARTEEAVDRLTLRLRVNFNYHFRLDGRRR